MNSWSDEERRDFYLPSHTNAFEHFSKGNVEMLRCLKQGNEMSYCFSTFVTLLISQLPTEMPRAPQCTSTPLSA